MTCQNCGASVPMGTIACPRCGKPPAVVEASGVFRSVARILGCLVFVLAGAGGAAGYLLGGGVAAIVVAAVLMVIGAGFAALATVVGQ